MSKPIPFIRIQVKREVKYKIYYPVCITVILMKCSTYSTKEYRKS